MTVSTGTAGAAGAVTGLDPIEKAIADIRAGRAIIVVEADVFADVHGESVLVSRLNATMSVLDLA